ncbi:MAG: ferrochelatase, partial [Steroidobacteraceae bacterium]
RPYTEELLLNYATQGPKQLSVLCPGFAANCLETLEEIALRNREAFLKAGGEYFDYIPALNAQPAHVQALQQLITRHAQHWLPLSNRHGSANLAAQLGAAQ